MMIECREVAYSAMREAVELTACRLATDIATKSAHRRLAERYADRVSSRTDWNAEPDPEW